MRTPAQLLAVASLAVSAWAADPFVGTWKWNRAKSQTGSADFKSRTFIVTATEQGHHIVQKDVLPDGTTMPRERDDVLDGKERASFEGLVVVAKRVDSHTKASTWTKAGKTVRKTTDTISKDGKTFTHSVNDLARGEGRVWVFERE